MVILRSETHGGRKKSILMLMRLFLS